MFKCKNCATLQEVVAEQHRQVQYLNVEINDLRSRMDAKAKDHEDRMKSLVDEIIALTRPASLRVARGETKGPARPYLNLPGYRPDLRPPTRTNGETDK